MDTPVNMEEVTSQESFHEFLTKLITVLEARMKEAKQQTGLPANHELFRFLSGMEVYVESRRDLKMRLEPSWETFAMLIRAGLWNAC